MPLILIVGANGELSDAADACRTRLGWRIASASRAADIPSELGDHHPHVILTDLWPASGDELVLQQIRRDYPDVPLVIVSDDEETTVRALGLGASSYVARSRLSRDLVTTIQRVLDLTGIEDREVVSPHLRRCHQQFDLPNDLKVIACTVRQMRKLAESMGVCGRHDSHRLSIALDEALMNAMIHGNLEVDSQMRAIDDQVYLKAIKRRMKTPPYADRRLALTANVTPDSAEFVVRDEGPGFTPEAVPDPTSAENLEKPYGRGLVLMKVFMDEVCFNEQGNEVTLLKRFCRRPAPLPSAIS